MASTFSMGLDLGGTDLKAGLVDERGRVARFLRCGSGVATSAAATRESIVGVYRELAAAAGADVVSVGLGVPGVVDPERGALVGATPNLPHWNDHPVRADISDALGRPVLIDNDANFAALGEYRMGAARGAKLALVLTIGTGVGCGIIAAGQILRGAFGGAGEIGHLPLGDESIACGCEVERCVEPQMCASGLVRRAVAHGLDMPNAKAVFAGAAAGHTEAVAWVERMSDRLGAAIGTAVNLLNPDVVVIGGGVSMAGDALLDPVRAAVARYSLASHRRGLRIVPAALGEHAGLVGAALASGEA